MVNPPPTVNWYLTGHPGIGKTTVVESLVVRLTRRGWAVDGLLAPERRKRGQRTGFDISDVHGQDRVPMASSEVSGTPSVGRYTVDTDAIERISTTVLSRARKQADAVVIDELGGMQSKSQVFLDEVALTLAAPIPTVLTVKVDGFRHYLELVGVTFDEIQLIKVDETNRDRLPRELTKSVEATLGNTA